MAENKISYIKEDIKVTGLKVNGKKLPDCSLNELSKVVAEELSKQDKGEK